MINKRIDARRYEIELAGGGERAYLVDAVAVDHVDEAILFARRGEVDELAASIRIDDRDAAALAQYGHVLEIGVVVKRAHRDGHDGHHVAVHTRRRYRRQYELG